jgi:hypothetical protein
MFSAILRGSWITLKELLTVCLDISLNICKMGIVIRLKYIAHIRALDTCFEA